MFDSLGLVFDTSDFPARWNCGNWSDAHGMTHVVSDVAIASAYAAIPFLLAWTAIRRKDVPFGPVLWLFVAFILSCGLGHLVEATLFWHPWYRLSAVVKVLTAAVSWATVIALAPVLVKVLRLPRLAQVNEQLMVQVEEQQEAVDELQAASDQQRRELEAMLAREDRILELKDEVNQLLRELDRSPRYGR